jgi:hypothetical protein
MYIMPSMPQTSCQAYLPGVLKLQLLDGCCLELQQAALCWVAVHTHDVACPVEQQVEGIAATRGQRQHCVVAVDVHHLQQQSGMGVVFTSARSDSKTMVLTEDEQNPERLCLLEARVSRPDTTQRQHTCKLKFIGTFVITIDDMVAFPKAPTFMSGSGSSQLCVYRKVGGNSAGRSTFCSWWMQERASAQGRPTQA